ncbi:MAG: HipA N-terminal domain-containing protein [Gammaproteobacteria bacterium]|nr:HipA N-terminal domain-containing protein [Gammaproteobacteria bacterium]
MIHVYDYCGNTKRLVGRLAQKDRVVFFEYAPEFLNTGIQLSPFKLPLKVGLIRCGESVFGEFLQLMILVFHLDLLANTAH